MTSIARHSAILDELPQLVSVDIPPLPDTGAYSFLQQCNSHHIHVTRVGLLLAYFMENGFTKMAGYIEI